MTEDNDKATPQKVFRVAIRAEGGDVNAYLASPDTMDDAVLMASIRRSLCDADPKIFDEWVLLMQSCMTVFCREVLGQEPTFDIVPAPEHDRAGSA